MITQPSAHFTVLFIDTYGTLLKDLSKPIYNLWKLYKPL